MNIKNLVLRQILLQDTHRDAGFENLFIQGMIEQSQCLIVIDFNESGVLPCQFVSAFERPVNRVWGLTMPRFGNSQGVLPLCAKVSR